MCNRSWLPVAMSVLTGGMHISAPGLADLHMSPVNPCLLFSNSGGRSDKVSDWPARQARIHQVLVVDTSTSVATVSGSREPASRSSPAIQRNESRCSNAQQQLND